MTKGFESPFHLPLALAVFAKRVEDPFHFIRVEKPGSTNRQRSAMDGGLLLDLLGNRHRDSEIGTERDGAMVGHQAREAAVERLHHPLSPFLAPERRIGRGGNAGSAADRNHIMQRRNLAVRAGEDGRVACSSRPPSASPGTNLRDGYGSCRTAPEWRPEWYERPPDILPRAPAGWGGRCSYLNLYT